MDEVDEGVSYVAPILVINRQVEEVISAFLGLVHSAYKHGLGVLVRDILNHDGRPCVFIRENLFNIQRVALVGL